MITPHTTVCGNTFFINRWLSWCFKFFKLRKIVDRANKKCICLKNNNHVDHLFLFDCNIKNMHKNIREACKR